MIQLKCETFSYMIQALNKLSNIWHMLISYHSVRCKILEKSQPFITFISLTIQMDIYHFLRENPEPTQFNSMSESVCLLGFGGVRTIMQNVAAG